ncbi:MAG TPA: right-handed parallel beta-helix repeat-containing protein [Stellaceae bacterium]|jgi:hypothetical protein|nr:right-handed parallel beta-helix repeat-containing protein [Stellaceae bacterium]
MLIKFDGSVFLAACILGPLRSFEVTKRREEPIRARQESAKSWEEIMLGTAKYWLGIVPILALGVAATPAEAASPTPISACPYTITAAGKYVVTNDLTATASCISTLANNVAVDLRGHTITGAGVGIGVGYTGDIGYSNILIANGTIRKFYNGIATRTNLVTIANMVISNNAGDGIASGGTVINTIASNNGLVGINASTAPSTYISGVQANGNGSYGIVFGLNSAVVNSEAVGNGNAGILSQEPGNLVSGTTARGNAGDGILLETAGGVGANYTTVIDSTFFGNDGNGISVGNNGSSVVGNTARNNTRAGILLACPSEAFGNTAQNNVGGNLVTTDNTCVLLDDKSR